MKFAVINDIHLGPAHTGYHKGVQRKLVGETERLVKEFVEKVNQDQPAFVMNLGDTIEDVNDKATDIEYYKRAVKLFSGLQMPFYSLVGNHDIRTLSQEEAAEILGHEKMYYSFDCEGYHFIALSFEMTGNHTHDLYDITAELPKKQMQWLEKDLAGTDLPSVIFMHYGMADDDMVGNFWFESQPHHALIANREEVRKIIEQSGKVQAVINGHQHWNRMFVHNNIPYFTVTSLVENTKNDGVPAEAHTIVTLNKDKIDLVVNGNDPAHYEFFFK